MVASPAPPTEDWPATQARALTGNQTNNPLLCRPALNPLSYTSQGLFSDIDTPITFSSNLILSKCFYIFYFLNRPHIHLSKNSEITKVSLPLHPHLCCPVLYPRDKVTSFLWILPQTQTHLQSPLPYKDGTVSYRLCCTSLSLNYVQYPCGHSISVHKELLYSLFSYSVFVGHAS